MGSVESSTQPRSPPYDEEDWIVVPKWQIVENAVIPREKKRNWFCLFIIRG